jgi:hypothetical protein
VCLLCPILAVSLGPKDCLYLYLTGTFLDKGTWITLLLLLKLISNKMTTACKGDGMLKMSKLPQNQYKSLFHLVDILTLDLSRALVGSHKIKELLTFLVFFKHMWVLPAAFFSNLCIPSWIAPPYQIGSLYFSISLLVILWVNAISHTLLWEPATPVPEGLLYFESFALFWAALSYPFPFVFLHLSLYNILGFP